MAAPIFISYSSKDQKIAETICRALEARGYDCWIACRNVGPGENFQEAIVHALRGAQLMLLVFTSNANNSNEIKKEVVLAGRHHVTVVPVRVEDVAPNDALAYEFATRQWIDLFSDWEREIERLVTQIGNIITNQAASPDADAAKAAPIALPPQPLPSARSRHVIALTVLVLPVLLGLGGGAYVYMRSAPQPAPSASTSSAPPASAQASGDAGAWQTATDLGTPQALRQYVDMYPEGAHAVDAQQRLQAADERAWSSAAGEGTVTALKHYVGLFPSGAHAAQARSDITALEQQPQQEEKPVVVVRRFDGDWQATIVCTSAGGAQGYTMTASGQVKDGTFHADHGVEGQPEWLTIDGQIQADGSADLHASGRTGPVRGVTVGNVPPGSPYGYTIQAKFTGSSATGTRKELRPCEFTALKH